MNTQAAEALDESETDAVVVDEGIVEPTVEAMLEMESPAVAGDDMADQDDAGSDDDAPERGAEAEDAARLALVLEGLLFAAGAPVPVARLVEALDGPDRKQVMRALDVLDAKLADDGR